MPRGAATRRTRSAWRRWCAAWRGTPRGWTAGLSLLLLVRACCAAAMLWRRPARVLDGRRRGVRGERGPYGRGEGAGGGGVAGCGQQGRRDRVGGAALCLLPT